MISVSKYNKIMEHIELTDEMRERILGNVSAKQKSRRISRIIMAAAAAACIAIVFVAASVIGNTGTFSRSHDKPVSAGSQVTAPTAGDTLTAGASSYNSAAELSEAFGIEIRDITELPFEAESVRYSLFIDSFAEIIYYGSEGEECCFRVGADTEDISGEYDGYTTAETEVINGCKVTLKGSGKSFTLVSWTDGGHFYSVSLVNGTDKADLLEIADEIMNAET